MAVADQENTGSQGQDLAKKTAIAAAAAAATGAATYAVRRAFSQNDAAQSNGDGESDGESRAKSKSGGTSLLASAAAGGWDAARDALTPIAEDAADAAGTYLAKSGPDFVKETIIPRFIEA